MASASADRTTSRSASTFENSAMPPRKASIAVLSLPALNSRSMASNVTLPALTSPRSAISPLATCMNCLWKAISLSNRSCCALLSDVSVLA